MIDQLSTILISTLSGGGFTTIIGAWLYRRQNKRLKESEALLAEANVAKAKIEGKSDEWELYKDQLNTANTRIVELLKINAEKEDRHMGDLKDWQERFDKQTDRLRSVQRDLIAANDREKEHIRREGLLLRRIQYLISFVCKRTDCDHGIPPRQHLLGCTFDESQIEDAEREKEITIDLTKS